MKKRVCCLLIAAVILLLQGCIMPRKKNTEGNEQKLIGTWYNSGTNSYCVFREDGTFSWGIGDTGDKRYPYTADNIDITIDADGHPEYYTYRIEGNKLYLCEETLETVYVRVGDN